MKALRLRPMRRRVKAPAIALAVLVLASAALLTQFASAAPTKSDAAGVLVIDNVFNNRNMDPQRESSSSANIALHVMYDTLVTFNGTDYSKVLPSLATLVEDLGRQQVDHVQPAQGRRLLGRHAADREGRRCSPTRGSINLKVTNSALLAGLQL